MINKIKIEIYKFGSKNPTHILVTKSIYDANRVVMNELEQQDFNTSDTTQIIVKFVEDKHD